MLFKLTGQAPKTVFGEGTSKLYIIIFNVASLTAKDKYFSHTESGFLLFYLYEKILPHIPLPTLVITVCHHLASLMMPIEDPHMGFSIPPSHS